MTLDTVQDNWTSNKRTVSIQKEDGWKKKCILCYGLVEHHCIEAGLHKLLLMLTPSCLPISVTRIHGSYVRL